MKVRYIKEGYFKNPEEARQEKERLASQTNAERLAKTSTATLIAPIKQFLTKFFENIPHGVVVNMNYYSPRAIMKKDYYHVYPNWISMYFISYNGGNAWFKRWLGKNPTVNIREIDYDNKTVKLDVIHPSPNYGRYSSRDWKAVFLFVNRVYNYFSEQEDWNDPREVYLQQSGISWTSFIFKQTMNDLLERYIKSDRFASFKSESDKDIVEFLQSVNYEVDVYITLDEDLILAPTVSGCSQDFFNGLNEECGNYIDINYYGLSKPWDWEKFAIKMTQNEGWIGANQFTDGCKAHSYEELAEDLKQHFEDWNIHIISNNDSHIYLSKGCFNKDYLVM